MARRLLKDTCELAAEIMDGKHDDDLDYIAQAATARKKIKTAEAGIRKHARIRVTREGGQIAGRVGKVTSVNQKTVSVELDPLNDNDWSIDWRVPHAWIEAENTPAAV